MNMKNNTSTMYVTVGTALAFVFGVFMLATPAQAKIIINYGNFKSQGGIVVNGTHRQRVCAGQGSYPAFPVTSAPVANNPTITPMVYALGPLLGSGRVAFLVTTIRLQGLYLRFARPTRDTPAGLSAEPMSTAGLYPAVCSGLCLVQRELGLCDDHGSSVTWSAYATGGNGYYTYSWNGS